MQDFSDSFEKMKVNVLQLFVKILKHVYYGDFDSKMDKDDSYIVVSHQKFLEMTFNQINLKKFKRSNLIELLKLVSSKSDGALITVMLKYRNYI